MNEKEQSLDFLYKTLPEILIPWYLKHARDLPWRKDREPYHVWLSEIMLQQTRVEAVKGYYTRFLKEFPTIADLAEADEDRLLKLWEGLGYYNRARNLQKAAKKIISENNGVFPSEYSEILTLPGIGEYTAGAIASNCFDEPVAAVDGNVLRVISRITESYEDIQKPAVKKQVKARLEAVYPRTRCGDFTQSLMELGAIVCVPGGAPKCGVCPMEDLCVAHRHGTEQKLPVKNTKKERKQEERTVFILRCGTKIAVKKRKKEGLLAGLWELPNISEKKTAKEAMEILSEWGASPVSLKREAIRKHVFSHIQWNMTGFYVECGQEAPEMEWVCKNELGASIALPTAFRQFLDEDFFQNV